MANDKSYLPNSSDVVQTIDITPAFRILRTMELDPYEVGGPKNLAEAVAHVAAAGDNFTGNDRKAAKISIAPGGVTSFNDLGALLGSLPKDSEMGHHNPPLTRDPTFDRVAEEKKNVGVKAWLYAASRENDNDFHTILGSDPAISPRHFMNAEVSGLPPAGSAALNTLKAIRASFAKIVQHTPLAGYDFYDPPLPVTVEASLFFDITHFGSPNTPGPAKTKPNTLWEMHPITLMNPRKP